MTRRSRDSRTDDPRQARSDRWGSGSRILLRSLGYLRPHRRYVAGSYALLLVNNGITLVMPLIIRFVVDSGIREGDLRAISWGVLGLLVLVLVRGLFIFLSGRWTEVSSQSVAATLRSELHDKLLSLSFSYHDRAETGQLLARAIGDVDRIRFLTGRALLRLAEVGTLLVGIGVSMVVMNARLAALVLLTAPFLVWRALAFGRRYRPMWGVIREQVSDLTSHLEQNLRGARVVTAFAQERAEIERFDRVNDGLYALHLTAARLQAINLPLLNLIASAGLFFVVYSGGRLVVAGDLTIGELVAFSTYVSQLLTPIRRLGMIVAAISQALASGERVFEILDARSEVRDEPGACPLGRVEGAVRFEHVSFAFGRHRVLDDVDFEVHPGMVVALLGATGSGKSSVINLIPRFYDPTGGRVLLDGRDVRQVTLASLREQIGIVLQDTTLFAATVRENVAFGRPGATEDEIVAAARAAAAHEFILDMEQGYDTPVGEKGVTLSGGQKQRIAIARALLKDPRLLILDDATSSVDTETEAVIQAALARLMEGRTSFVIAQRLSTVRQADLVLLLDRGRVVARGRRTDGHTAHEELLRTSGLYAEIYQRQLRPGG